MPDPLNDPKGWAKAMTEQALAEDYPDPCLSGDVRLAEGVAALLGRRLHRAGVDTKALDLTKLAKAVLSYVDDYRPGDAGV